jgi:hypothetical protein
MRVNKSPQKPDPRLEVLLERLMDAAPSSSDPPEAVAYPSGIDPMLFRYAEPRRIMPLPTLDDWADGSSKVSFINGYVNKPSDSLFEDVIEWIDPTGITSWDDASRAYDSYTERIKNTNKYSPTIDEFFDVLSVIPAVGKIPKAAKAARGASRYISPAVKAVKNSATSFRSPIGFILDRSE